MELSALYFFQHISSVVNSNRKLKIAFTLSSGIIFFIIYLLKPDTYDIPSYVKSVDYPYFEPLFTYFILFLRNFFDNRTVILIIQIFAVFLSFLTIRLYIKKFEDKSERLVSYAYAAFSVAFTLGVNNGLRSYIASLIIFISIWFFFEKRFLISFLIFLLSPFIHLSSSIFYPVIFIIIVFSKKKYFKKIEYKVYYKSRYEKPVSQSILFWLFLSLTVLGMILLPYLIKFTPYYNYFNRNITNGRVDFTIKYIPTLLIYLFSEYFFGKLDREDYIFSQLRILRMFFMILMGNFIFFNSLNEMASRVLGFYYTLEMLILSLSNVKGYKNGSIIISIGYAFAINAMNIIGKI